MTEEQKPTPTAEEFPLVISFLREDIQDVRQDLRQSVNQLHDELREHRQSTREEIQFVQARMDARFNQVIGSLIGVAGLVVASASVVVVMLKP